MVMPRAFSSGAVVDLVVGLGFAAEFLGEHGGDGRRQGGLAVVHVTDGAHVHVRLGPLKFLFCHVEDSEKSTQTTHESGDAPWHHRDCWCPWRESDPRPLPYQGSALPLSHKGDVSQERNRNCKPLERETGIEPASLAWKAKVLPLNYSRSSWPPRLAP
jgi:hypothetical protein